MSRIFSPDARRRAIAPPPKSDSVWTKKSSSLFNVKTEGKVSQTVEKVGMGRG
jgi:hypothetical protein